MWKFPVELTKIDATYEDCDQNIWFFIGRQYVVFNGMTFFKQGFLTDIGIPGNVEKIDAIFKFTANEYTYVFSGSIFWK
jgi:hypothetical protein